ncbi:MAG TPA: hydroxyacylglutathione hydrolase, partial [Gammaproteobacteria bacterium]|nr:hydroxyacylglutathione hydrolase [Gammaproteobacteria bacterium]
KQRRKQGYPTLPSTLALELKTNPFLRTQQPAVMTAASRQAGKPLQTHREIFAVLRRWKDTEYD